ncbi:peptidyl-tRNA hydrolase isoform X3 [Bos indicus]|nr:peptidyl-tRNA hydrolase isoform X3 [Bos taurus]
MAVLGQLARRLGVAESWERDRRCAADLAQASLGDAQLVLLRPRRLMNLNGHSVAQAVVTGATVSLGQVELFGLTAEEVYLVHDELDKPLGKVALKLGGSARGHNGVRSCMSCLNSNAMPRLQVGIGRPTHRDAVQAYVLGRFSPAEQELLPPVLERAVDLLLGHIHQRSRESSSGP